MQDLPFAPSCENNKGPILEVLQRHFFAVDGTRNVLEIASGTGQHAVHFAHNMPQLRWQCTELPEHLIMLNRRLQLAELSNLPAALALNVGQERWEFSDIDYVFTANSLHIMPLQDVAEFFRHLGPLLKTGGRVAVYGPFKYHGEFTTPSNAQFDIWLKGRDPRSGVRDFEQVSQFAAEAGLTLLEDNAMPANNQLLVWQK